MADQPYTLARWRVAPGREDAFVAAWRGLAAVFLALKAPPRWGTLLRSVDDPRLFDSFGPWPSVETIAAMRAHAAAAGAIGRLEALCEGAELGTYLVAATAGEEPRVT
ncbi:MAG: hypothetical protein ACLGI3_06355 [Actinomycetes bacterium]